MRMMRRAGLLGTLKIPTLGELFANTTLLAHKGGTSTVSVSLSGIDTSIPFYCFCMTGPQIEISKIVGTTKTVLSVIGTRGVSVTSSVVSITASATIVLMRFPNYAPSAIDEALSNMTVVVKASYYSTGATGTCSFNSNNTPINSDAFYVATYYHGSGPISVSKGDNILSAIITTSTTSGRMFLYKNGTTYSVSSNGTSAISTNMEGVYELTDAA